MYPFVRALDYVQLAGANQGHAIDQRPFCFFQSNQAVIDGAGLIQTALP